MLDSNLSTVKLTFLSHQQLHQSYVSYLYFNDTFLFFFLHELFPQFVAKLLSHVTLWGSRQDHKSSMVNVFNNTRILRRTCLAQYFCVESKKPCGANYLESSFLSFFLFFPSFFFLYFNDDASSKNYYYYYIS